jgi:hypothetical protein
MTIESAAPDHAIADMFSCPAARCARALPEVSPFEEQGARENLKDFAARAHRLVDEDRAAVYLALFDHNCAHGVG